MQDERVGPEAIVMNNPMEEAANRYWRASRIWREKEESNWNYGDMIGELCALRCYRGIAPHLAQSLLDEVISYDAAEAERHKQQTLQQN